MRGAEGREEGRGEGSRGKGEGDRRGERRGIGEEEERDREGRGRGQGQSSIKSATPKVSPGQTAAGGRVGLLLDSQFQRDHHTTPTGEYPPCEGNTPTT